MSEETRKQRIIRGLKRRLKVFGIAIPIFLILSILLGSAAQFGGGMYRQSYIDQGYSFGERDGAKAGYLVGWEEGVQSGYAAGNIDGFIGGYRNGVLALNDPYHQAALIFEQSCPYMDVLSSGILAGNLFIVVQIPEVGITEDEAAQANIATAQLFRSIYQGEPIVFIAVVQYYPQYQTLVLVKVLYLDTETFEAIGEEYIYQPLSADFVLWPSNPYLDQGSR